MANEKPCLTCTMVADPEKCDCKSCKAWREWFVQKWDEMRKLNEKPLERMGSNELS